jgi:hypothetical protein
MIVKVLLGLLVYSSLTISSCKTTHFPDEMGVYHYRKTKPKALSREDRVLAELRQLKRELESKKLEETRKLEEKPFHEFREIALEARCHEGDLYVKDEIKALLQPYSYRFVRQNIGTLKYDRYYYPDWSEISYWIKSIETSKYISPYSKIHTSHYSSWLKFGSWIKHREDNTIPTIVSVQSSLNPGGEVYFSLTMSLKDCKILNIKMQATKRR